ncbi:hypothetical protein E8L99_14860 [Phreatobacter aquaticus]|uniref:Uncharacterized protein n=1 Tax=Phreatobacter aquaticus TaxID=2570229 RepID=A0A4D7QIQ8_9HYPH|nr:hypothetical protein [Phreatobacter aquaticus]QCK86945.1 hypothetical protein E8L99_14860 [Phreatobacter aquaticus]
MLKWVMVAALATAALGLSPDAAEARHRRHHISAEGWCRADAAQMMGISRRAIRLDRLAATPGGRYEIRGIANHGRHGFRAFTCHFDERRVLQGAI